MAWTSNNVAQFSLVNCTYNVSSIQSLSCGYVIYQTKRKEVPKRLKTSKQRHHINASFQRCTTTSANSNDYLSLTLIYCSIDVNQHQTTERVKQFRRIWPIPSYNSVFELIYKEIQYQSLLQRNMSF
ncbi:Hypothetical_protein [Hexamita inflata]|uniref:Hypothetical_protein n=1 Tax=Hexamita inflata TaxID=28002 RepID=A0AA86UA78_9EUKA|nr:Hypothetical protein HINF_LOCUS32446 [Hexamita inflata]